MDRKDRSGRKAAARGRGLSACGVERYDYYNLCGEKIRRDHRPGIYPLPACTDVSGFYYHTAGLSVSKLEDAEMDEKILEKTADAGENAN